MLDGLMFTTVATKRNRLWRLLVKMGCIATTPVPLMKFTPYNIPPSTYQRVEKGYEMSGETLAMILRWLMADLN